MQRKVYPNEWLGLSLTKLELGIAPRREFEEFASPCACLPRVTKSDKSAGSDMRSGSLPKHKHRTLSFDGALPSPTPEEQKARGRVEARKCTANSRVHRLLTFYTRGLFSLDSMGSFAHGAMSMFHVHVRC